MGRKVCEIRLKNGRNGLSKAKKWQTGTKSGQNGFKKWYKWVEDAVE